jgi:hypothetical protein
VAQSVTDRGFQVRHLAPLALLFVVATACGGGGGTSKGPRKDIRPQDQARADSIILKLDDLPHGWRAEKSNEEQSGPNCFEPDLSDLTETGTAESPNFFSGSTTFVSSGAGMYASKSDAQAAYERVAGQELADCIAEYLTAYSDKDVSFENLSSGRLSFPSLGDRSAAYEIAMEIKTNGFSPAAFVDFVVIQRGRAVGAVVYFDVGSPFEAKMRERLARRFAQRMKGDRE